jgi:murein DD-endopeptidase MepM/ murein hydrolase activator NlpD
MDNFFSFIVISNSGSLRKQVSFSKGFLQSLLLLFFISILLVIFFLNAYLERKKAIIDTKDLNRIIAAQLKEITGQRKQIHAFTNKINQLKESLCRLEDLEEKLRIIANIEKTDEQDSLFGVGANIPEDLEPNVDRSKSHKVLLNDMQTQIAMLNSATEHQKKNFNLLRDDLEKKVKQLAATPSIQPTEGWVTSRFGYRKSPFTGRKEFHKGLDIAARKGNPIVAPADGVITYAGSKGLLGKVVVIDHGYGLVTRYGHLGKICMKKGDKVKREDIIARVGMSGRTTGPHLHYEVHQNGKPVNPSKFIQK